MKYAVLALALIASPALAQTSGQAAITTDYVSRGTSQTYAKPSVQVYVEHQRKKFYAAGFAAYVDFNDGTALETDLFVGYRDKLSKSVSVDISGAYIGYQGTKVSAFNPTGKWDMVEAKATVTAALGPVSVNATVAATPDYFNIYGPSVWAELGASGNVHKRVNVSAAFGRQFMERGFSYSTWNAGATLDVGDGFLVEARYYNTNRHDLDSIYKPRVAFTLKKNF